jgi:hypothetical protein
MILAYEFLNILKMDLLCIHQDKNKSDYGLQFYSLIQLHKYLGKGQSIFHSNKPFVSRTLN